MIKAKLDLDNIFCRHYDIYNCAIDIIKKLKKFGYQGWFIGGAVRDALLQYPVYDIDICVNARPEIIREIFNTQEEFINRFGVIRIVKKGIKFDIVSFRRDGNYRDSRHPDIVIFTDKMEEDAQRRDFTINALYYDPIERYIFDFFDGLSDLNRGVLRTIGSSSLRIVEDKIRILRAIRFVAKLNFKLDNSLERVIYHRGREIIDISIDRIRDEITEIITGRNADKGFKLLIESGVLSSILPEVYTSNDIVEFKYIEYMFSRFVFPTEEVAWAVLFFPLILKIIDGIYSLSYLIDLTKRLRFNNTFRRIFINFISISLDVVNNQFTYNRDDILSNDNLPILMEFLRLYYTVYNNSPNSFFYISSKLYKKV